MTDDKKVGHWVACSDQLKAAYWGNSMAAWWACNSGPKMVASKDSRLAEHWVGGMVCNWAGKTECHLVDEMVQMWENSAAGCLVEKKDEKTAAQWVAPTAVWRVDS